MLELAAIDLAVAAVPFALAMPLALVELAGVPAAIRVVDASLTLQQAIDQFTAIASAVRQASVRRQRRFAVAASGEHQGQGKECKWAHSGFRAIRRGEYAAAMCPYIAVGTASEGAKQRELLRIRDGLHEAERQGSAMYAGLSEPSISRVVVALSSHWPGFFSVTSDRSTFRRTFELTLTGWMKRTLSRPYVDHHLQRLAAG